MIGFVSKLVFALMVISFVWLVMEGTLYYIINLEKDILSEEVEDQNQKEKNDLINEYKELLRDVKNSSELFNLDLESRVEIIDFVFTAKTPRVFINSVSIEKGETVTFVGIGGIADNRESLSNLKDTLDQSVEVEQVDLPVSSFTKTFDIPFTITFIYKYE